MLLIPGMFDNADETFGISRNAGVWWSLNYNDFDKEHIYVWDYDSSKDTNDILANDNNDLFKKMTDIFNEYASAGIVCTKADIVAHGMGGLMARKIHHRRT